MNTDGDAQGQQAKGAFVRLNARTVIAVSEVCGDLRSQRMMQTMLGDLPVEVHQFAEPAETPAFESLSLSSAFDNWGFDGGQRARAIASLAHTIAPMFRLVGDHAFLTLLGAYLADLSSAPVGLEVHAIGGGDGCLVIAASRARLVVGDLLITLGGGLSVGALDATAPFLAEDRDGERLCSARFSIGSPAANGGYVVTGDGRVLRVEQKVRRYASELEFYETHGKERPDLVRFLAAVDHSCSPALRRLLRQAPTQPALHEPLLGLLLEIELACPLAHGLFVCGWHADPDALISGVVVIDHGLDDPDLRSQWRTYPALVDLKGRRQSVTRFVAFLPRRPEFSAIPAPEFRLDLANGEMHRLTAAQVSSERAACRALILATIVRSGFDVAMLENVYRPAIKPLQDAINDRQAVRAVQDFGTASMRRASLIIPLYRETRFIRSQLMAFAADPFVRAHAELVYAVDDPTIAAEVEALLTGARFVYDLDIRLVTLELNGGYALANNFGVAQARGDVVVLMNSDVAPDEAGWLEQALERLSHLPPFSVIGPRLVYADGALQHAGIDFERLPNGGWQNFHRWKGYGRDYAPATVERVVQAVTGACMILRKSDFEAVGGLTTDYVIGDFEDSDLCLKLRQEGGLPVYTPSITLVHLERQSMATDDDAEPGSTQYNRMLHTLIWDAAISDLVARGLDHAL